MGLTAVKCPQNAVTQPSFFLSFGPYVPSDKTTPLSLALTLYPLLSGLAREQITQPIWSTSIPTDAFLNIIVAQVCSFTRTRWEGVNEALPGNFESNAYLSLFPVAAGRWKPTTFDKRDEIPCGMFSRVRFAGSRCLYDIKLLSGAPVSTKLTHQGWSFLEHATNKTCLCKCGCLWLEESESYFPIRRQVMAQGFQYFTLARPLHSIVYQIQH